MFNYHMLNTVLDDIESIDESTKIIFRANVLEILDHRYLITSDDLLKAASMTGIELSL